MLHQRFDQTLPQDDRPPSWEADSGADGTNGTGTGGALLN